MEVSFVAIMVGTLTWLVIPVGLSSSLRLRVSCIREKRTSVLLSYCQKHLEETFKMIWE